MEKNQWIPFTLTYHPKNSTVKTIILKTFKIIQKDPETSQVFSFPPIVSLKCTKNRWLPDEKHTKIQQLTKNLQMHKIWCKICPFIQNTKVSGPKQSNINDWFIYISTYVILYTATVTCKKFNIGKTENLQTTSTNNLMTFEVKWQRYF